MEILENGFMLGPLRQDLTPLLKNGPLYPPLDLGSRYSHCPVVSLTHLRRTSEAVSNTSLNKQHRTLYKHIYKQAAYTLYTTQILEDKYFKHQLCFYYGSFQERCGSLRQPSLTNEARISKPGTCTVNSFQQTFVNFTSIQV